MRVNYNYLPDEFKNHKKIFIEWKKLIKTSEFTLGYKVLEFEKNSLTILVLNIVFLQTMELTQLFCL